MSKEREEEKKAYDKPKVTRFPLRPQEAVLGFCKSGGDTGPSTSCAGPPSCPFPGS